MGHLMQLYAMVALPTSQQHFETQPRLSAVFFLVENNYIYCPPSMGATYATKQQKICSCSL